MAKTKASLTSAKRKQILKQLKDDPIRGPHRYNTVVSAAELENIVLVACDFVVQPRYFTGERVERELGGSPGHFRLDDEGGVATIAIVWTVRAWEKGHKDKPTLAANCTYVARYGNLHGQDPAAAEAFARRVSGFATYPYFRSFIAQLSAASGANLPVLPLLKEGSGSGGKAARKRKQQPRPEH